MTEENNGSLIIDAGDGDREETPGQTDVDSAGTAPSDSDEQSQAEAQGEEEGEDSEAPKKKPHRLRKILLIVLAVIVVVGGAAVFYAFWTGALAPADAAAKYDGLTYITESQVDDYISDYKQMMSMSDADDETWATFLAENNLTPSILRQATIHQLICDALIDKVASEDGISVSDDEVQQVIDEMKSNIAFDDDSIWTKTLSQAGRTEEQVEDTYRQELLAQKVYTQEVSVPDPTDDQIKEYMISTDASLSSPTVKHIYRFTITGFDEGGSYKKISKVQKIRRLLIKDGLTKDNFNSYVQMFSDDSDLQEKGGADGWSIDSDSRSTACQEAIESTAKGSVSEVFKDTDGYSFIWIDRVYKLPTSEKAIKKLDLSKIPKTLEEYLSGMEGYILWKEDSQTYLENLVTNAGVLYYPMPSDASYNVDMSLADTSTSSSSDSGSSDDSSSSSDSSEDSSSSSGTE